MMANINARASKSVVEDDYYGPPDAKRAVAAGIERIWPPERGSPYWFILDKGGRVAALDAFPTNENVKAARTSHKLGRRIIILGRLIMQSWSAGR
jgi:hypothetical protein